MNTHKNAAMTPKGRAYLVREIDRIGLKAAAAAAGLSERTARKWLRRHASEGASGLIDRSSRPLHQRMAPIWGVMRVAVCKSTMRRTNVSATKATHNHPCLVSFTIRTALRVATGQAPLPENR